MSSNPSQAIDAFDIEIEKVSNERSNIGAIQNRLEHSLKIVNLSHENLTAAESRIRDLDMAKEMVSMTKVNILSQVSQTLLAQANQ